MLDLTNIKYKIAVMDENNNQYDITDYVCSTGWEENKNEISVRLSFSVKNDETALGKLSNLIKPGCVVGIFAACNDGFSDEVARGFVTNWNPTLQNNADSLKCTNYDILYNLQQSQDNRFYSSGTGTQAIITQLLEDYEIPTNDYSGPDVAHGKLKYNNSYVADIIRDVLDDVKKKGYGTYLLRATKGYVNVVERGSNTDIYVFKVENTKSVSATISTADLVTRVRVVGQADDEGKTSVEATLNGLTQYGIKQKIYTRGTDESLADAETAAQELLNENGTLDEAMTIVAPDIPFLRKGDIVYVMASVSNDYYYVVSIRHDCDTHSMTIDLEKAKTETIIAENETTQTREYNVGDIVTFNGGTHYVSSYLDAQGYEARAGQAKITIKDGSGEAHPWHLIHTDSESNVYGWVDNGTFS